MLPEQHKTQLPSAICYSKVFRHEESIALLDAKKNLRLISIENYNVISGLRINDVSTEHFAKNSKMVSLSNNKVLVAITDIDTKVVHVYNIVKKVLAFEVTWHKGLAEVLEFDPMNRYLATGGQDGKLCLWFFNTGKLAYTATSHQDFISCIAFEQKGKFLASASYDKTLTVMSMYSMNPVASFRGHHASVITNMTFIQDTDFLITVDRSGHVGMWDYVEKKFKKFLFMLSSQPSGICIIKRMFLFIATSNGSVSLYNLSTNEVVDKNYIFVKDGIQNIFYIEQLSTLLIISNNKTAIHFNPFIDKEDLQNSIASDDYEEAYKIVRENLILKYTKEYSELEEIWKNSWADAISALEEDNSIEAYDILSPFQGVPEKNKDAQLLVSGYKEFQKFKISVKKKNYQLAYSLLNAYSFYKDSASYQAMEDDWNERVEKAIKVIESNPPDIDDKLKILFGDFRGISHKLQFIRECRDKRNVLSMFNKLLSQEKYSSCFSLAEKYSFLKKLGEYENLLLLQESLSQQAEQSLENGEWQGAKSYATELSVFPEYTKRAKAILNHIEQTSNFYTLLAQKKYADMMKLAVRYKFLTKTKEYNNFLKHIDAIVAKAEDFVPTGNIQQILKISKPYKNIPGLVEKFGKILASAYIQQLFYLAKKSKDTGVILSALNIYAKIFGIDNNLTVYITNLKENMGINLMTGGTLEDEALIPDYKKWLTMKMPLKIFDSLIK